MRGSFSEQPGTVKQKAYGTSSNEDTKQVHAKVLYLARHGLDRNKSLHTLFVFQMVHQIISDCETGQQKTHLNWSLFSIQSMTIQRLCHFSVKFQLQNITLISLS